MKNSIKFLGIALLLLFNTSCSNEELETENTQTTEDKSISDYIASKSEYSDITEAFKMTDFNSYLENENARLFGSYTFFLPTNEAFRTFLNENGFSSLAAVPPATLREILANHLLNTRLFASQIETGYVSTNASGPNNSKISMYLNTTNGVKINGSVNVIRPNIRVLNGVIHVVDKVIAIPTVVTHAVANPNFTSLVAALTRQGNTTDFVSVLSSNGPFTVFAPTNDAFGSLLTELNTTFGVIPEPVLDKVLKYHVVAGNVRSTNLPVSGSVIPTIAGNTPGTSFTLLTSPTIRLKDANNRECPIVATDVQASNGVIHVLSRVLLPN